jgi:hypothetical protein
VFVPSNYTVPTFLSAKTLFTKAVKKQKFITEIIFMNV